MEILPYNPPDCWLTRSSPSRPWHLVDLEYYGGNGACSCWDFEMRKEPELRKGKRSARGLYRCKHVEAVKLVVDRLKQMQKI